MGNGNNSPDLPMYKEMEDTPWITQLRSIADKGGQGVLENYNKVNVFDEPARQSIYSRVNDVYSRANSDFDRNYRDTMQNLANRNYSQFGTLNATPAAYRTDLQNLAEQRKLADLAYNKANYTDQVINNELQRRYNTLNMFNNMLAQGQTPYQQDVRNWQIRNQNLDRGYYNDLGNSSGGFLGTLGGGLAGAALGGALGSIVPGVGTSIGAQIGAGLGGQAGSMIH